MNMENYFKTFYQNLDYAFNSYKFFLTSLQNPECRNLVKTHRFDNVEQINGYEIELSWAFFVRMESVLETFIHQFDSEKKTKKGIENLIGVEGMKSFDDNEKEGLTIYRVVRNTLHHGDGNPNLINNKKGISLENDKELQLNGTITESYYNLFFKIVKVLEDQVNKESSNK